MPLNTAVELPDSDRAELSRWLRAPSMPAGLAQRARIVLLAADGRGTNEIVTRTGVSKPTVIAWRKRYAAEGIAALQDRPKPGRPAQVDEVAVVLATLEPPPQRLGVTHWSSRLLAGELGISIVWVARIWRKWGLQPWRRRDVQVLHRPAAGGEGPRRRRPLPEPAGEGSRGRVDEKSQIQALDRTAPILPMRPGPAGEGHPRLRPPRHHHAVRRAGDRHRQGHRRLLSPAPARGVPALPPPRRQGLPPAPSCTSSPTTTPPTSTPSVQAWLAKNPRITLHFTPTCGSWLNMVEIFFGIITRQAIRRGTFRSSRTSSPPSRPTSTAGTNAASPSPGPRPPTKSSPRQPAVKENHSRDTRTSRGWATATHCERDSGP